MVEKDVAYDRKKCRSKLNDSKKQMLDILCMSSSLNCVLIFGGCSHVMSGVN